MWAACEPALPGGDPAGAVEEAAGGFQPALDLQTADAEAALLRTVAASARVQLGAHSWFWVLGHRAGDCSPLLGHAALCTHSGCQHRQQTSAHAPIPQGSGLRALGTCQVPVQASAAWAKGVGTGDNLKFCLASLRKGSG